MAFARTYPASHWESPKAGRFHAARAAFILLHRESLQ